MTSCKVTSEIDRISAEHDAQLIAVAGDVRARQMIHDEVSQESRAKLLHGQQDHTWREEVEEQVCRWDRVSTERAMTPADPVNPERVVHELNALLPRDAQVAVDVGSSVYWYARQLRLPRGVPAHLSSTLGCMGAGVPYGIAAKLAGPSRPVVVLAGDGAMQLAGLAELVTVAKLWRDWADPRFVVCVFSNRDLAEVSWEQREMEGERRFEASQALPDVDCAAPARLLGLDGVRVTDPDDLAEAWRRASCSAMRTSRRVRAGPRTCPYPPPPRSSTDRPPDSFDCCPSGPWVASESCAGPRATREDQSL
ncbi:thiamine pyrophosphate-dependent enzyme [Arthrobacter sp. MDT2-2]